MNCATKHIITELVVQKHRVEYQIDIAIVVIVWTFYP